jgi:hypothetical protein
MPRSRCTRWHSAQPQTTLRSCAYRFAPSQACIDALAASARPLLAEHARRFASELWGFLQSGLTVAGHDTATFGCGRGPKRRREGAASNDRGQASSGESGEARAGTGGGGRGSGAASEDPEEGAAGGRLWAAYGEDLAGGEDY